MLYFSDWGYLFLLILIPIILFWYKRKGKYKEQSITFSSIKAILEISGNQKWKIRTIHSLKILAITFFIIALARPQKGNVVKEISTEGIDIVLVLDISSSMRALDFKPNRLEAAKSVAKDFIDGRSNDRIGLVVFAGETFLQCPLTIDYNVLKTFLAQVDIVEKKYDGTAIGMAIANAINRLRDSKAKSKVMILLSDGRNNTGKLDPETATDMAKTFGIKIYTIGAGKRGKAEYPVQTFGGRTRTQLVDVQIDDEVLTKVAESTGGKYFRATNKKKLAEVYKEISEMEKTEIKVKEFFNYHDLYIWFLFPGLLMLLTGIILERFIWRKTP